MKKVTEPCAIFECSLTLWSRPVLYVSIHRFLHSRTKGYNLSWGRDQTKRSLPRSASGTRVCVSAAEDTEQHRNKKWLISWFQTETVLETTRAWLSYSQTVQVAFVCQCVLHLERNGTHTAGYTVCSTTTITSWEWNKMDFTLCPFHFLTVIVIHVFLLLWCSMEG